MTILICIPCLLVGGTEIQTLNLVEALVAAGHNPIVACYFEYAPEMLERYRSAGAEVCLFSPDGTRPHGIKATITHLWKGLKAVVKNKCPDAAHVQYMAPGALPIFILRVLGVKTILATSHTDADIYGKNGIRIIQILTNHLLTAFQCITLRAEESYFGTSRLFDGKLTKHFTIYNSLPSYITVTDAPRQSSGAPLTIGVVSRLESIKGMDLVIPAFALVAREHPDCRLLIVGDGSLRTAMELQATESSFADRIEFAGRQDPDTIQSYYDRIDILLMPSRSEGFGLTAIEGMARGCVPVVANVGGLPEVVVDGECGLLHHPEDPTDIARAICALLSHSEQFDRLRTAALSRGRLFTFDKYASAFANLYSRLFS